MTVQPTRDQPMTDHDRMNYWWRRATQAEARIKAVADICDLSAEDAEDMDAISAHYASGYEIALQDIRRTLDGDA